MDVLMGPKLGFFSRHQPEGVPGGVDRLLEQDLAGRARFDVLLQAAATDKGERNKQDTGQ